MNNIVYTLTKLYSVKIELIAWGLIWLTNGLIFTYLNKKGISFTKKVHITITWFITLFITIVSLFSKEVTYILEVKVFQCLTQPFSILFFKIRFIGLFIFLILLVSIALVYYLIKKYYNHPNVVIKTNPRAECFLLDYKYILTRTLDIINQDLLLFIFVIILHVSSFNDISISILVALTFGLGHIYVVLKRGKKIGLLTIIIGIIASYIIPLLALHTSCGIFIGISIHWLFYLVLGITPWLKQGRVKS